MPGGARDAGGRAMTGQGSAEQIRRRRERDRINHARARARDRGEDPGKIGGPEPAVRRVALPVSRAPQTGWQDRAACRTSPPQWVDAETDANAAKACGCARAARCAATASGRRPPTGRSPGYGAGWTCPRRLTVVATLAAGLLVEIYASTLLRRIRGEATHASTRIPDVGNP